MNSSILLLRLIALSSCLVGNAFGQSGPHGQRPPLHAAPSGAQAPRLLATFVHAHAQRSLAVVRVAGTSAQTLHVGDELGGGLRVHAIAHDHVVLARGARLSTLPLLGLGSARRTPSPGPHGTTAGLSTAGKASVAASVVGEAVLRADNLDAVRAACMDPSLMAALPDAQKAELGALGVCAQR